MNALDVRMDLSVLRGKSGWLIAFGIIGIVLGAVAIGMSVATTFVSIILFGWMLVFGGGSLFIGACFSMKGWSGFLAALLIGILQVVIGLVILANPASSIMALTLVIASLLVVGGIFRIVLAVSQQFENWGWMALQGCLVFLLGISIWRQWPFSGLWTIGLFVGIELFLNGWWVLFLGLTVRRLSTRADPAAEDSAQ
jgi:uncharacterized membrane protein HdeD (DUF308 family)